MKLGPRAFLNAMVRPHSPELLEMPGDFRESVPRDNYCQSLAKNPMSLLRTRIIISPLLMPRGLPGTGVMAEAIELIYHPIESQCLSVAPHRAQTAASHINDACFGDGVGSCALQDVVVHSK